MKITSGAQLALLNENRKRRSTRAREKRAALVHALSANRLFCYHITLVNAAELSAHIPIVTGAQLALTNGLSIIVFKGPCSALEV